MESADVFYTTQSLLHTFNNSLNQHAVKRVFQMKGIYVAGKGTNYSNFYYDTLKDEHSDSIITLVLPGIIRSKLHNNELIEFTGFLTKKIQFSSGRIDLQVNLVELLSQNKSTHSEIDIKVYELLQSKSQIGYKDVDAFIKKSIIDAKPINIKILIGKNAIIDSDIKHQLQDASAFYSVEFIRISLASESEIIYALNKYSKETNILVISRGGGENMAIFNSILISEQALHLKCYFVTAIGHKEDNSLLQKLADKAFITPTAFGQHLREIYNNTIAELQNSKAHLVKQITVQLEANYKQQIETLVKSRTFKEEENINYRDEIIYLKKQLKQQQKNKILIFLALLLMIIITVFILLVKLFD